MLNCTKEPNNPVGDFSVMIIMAIFMPLVAAFGLLGNIMSFVILKDSSMKVSSFFYIRCLTIFDSLTLIFTMFGFYAVLVIHPILNNYSHHTIDFIWLQWGMCQIRTYMAYTSRTLSVWTIVVFTLERFICIKFPFFSIKLCTIRNAKIITSLIVIVSLICNLDWIFSFDKFVAPGSSIPLCKIKDNKFIFRILDMVMLSVVPAVIIIFCNIVIILTLRRRRKLSLVAYEDNLNKRRDLKITLQLLVVSTTFTILTIPQFISVLINTYHEKRNLKNHLKGNLANFYHISFLLFTLNFSINFILYCFIGDNFRNAAVNIVLCRLQQMKVLRRAIFETVSNDTKNTTVSRNITKRNSILRSSDIKMNTIPREKNPLVKKTEI